MARGKVPDALSGGKMTVDWSRAVHDTWGDGALVPWGIRESRGRGSATIGE